MPATTTAAKGNNDDFTKDIRAITRKNNIAAAVIL